jgi:hypothetical protein
VEAPQDGALLRRRRRRRLLLPSQLFMRIFVGGRAVLVSQLAMFVSSHGVRLGLFVLAEIVMKGGLMVVMGGGVVVGGGLMMMLARRMLRRLGHGVFPPNRSIPCAGCRFDMGRLQFAATPAGRR